jgi:hypothetical protein
VGSDSVDFQNPCSIVCDHHQPEFVSSDVEHHPVVGKKIGGVEATSNVLSSFPFRAFGFRQPGPERSTCSCVLFDELLKDLLTDNRHVLL